VEKGQGDKGSSPFNSGRSMIVSSLTLQMTIHLVQTLSLETETIDPALEFPSLPCDGVVGSPTVYLGRKKPMPAFVASPPCRSISLNAPAIASAPLTPVPATKHTTVLYRAGSAGVKYGPSRRRETGTGFGTWEEVAVGWSESEGLEGGVDCFSFATSARRSVHCENDFRPRRRRMRAKNEGAKPKAGAGSMAAGLAGFARERKRNWMVMSSEVWCVMVFWEARCVVVVKG